jgi:hypothetical protein
MQCPHHTGFFTASATQITANCCHFGAIAAIADSPKCCHTQRGSVFFKKGEMAYVYSYWKFPDWLAAA